jgi:3-methyladenine DNA glycosylase/8-oxoguanine DNA glycosylase
MISVEVRPRGPYSLALSARLASDATRSFRDGVFTARLPAGDAAAWQCPDGTVRIRAAGEDAAAQLRFCLALDDDHTPFLVRFADDPLLGRATRVVAGLRPVRTATVAHALLRALCGQLIDSRTARAIERRVVRAATPSEGALRRPPTREDLARLSPAQLRSLGLHARRGATLARICAALDPERLRSLPGASVRERLGRERGLGPWSVGVVCLQGLGRFDHGLEGDLGLIKLLAALRGRRVDAWETAELLAPYGEYAGLASVYLLTAFSRGLVPLSAPT